MSDLVGARVWLGERVGTVQRMWRGITGEIAIVKFDDTPNVTLVDPWLLTVREVTFEPDDAA